MSAPGASPPPGVSDAGGGADPELELRGLEKRFGDTVAVDGLDLRLGRGEFLTLLGPSGCGKTTVLRLVAGFETPDAGAVRFRGREVTGWSPRRRGFGMVFQNYALFPHLDVFENVAFGLRSRGREEAEIERRVRRVLELVDLAGFGERRVQRLSGGQQQRVALARALAIEPALLLLDEPLSNLDAALRERTRVELRLLVKELGVATLFVTHDQEEAFDLSDRVAVMEAGRLRQVGTPEELYDAPADPFVAGFVGSANRFRARLGEGGGTAVLEDGTAWPLPEGTRRAPGLTPPDAELWIRPEDLELVREREADERGDATEDGTAGRADDAPLLRGVVRDRRFRGAVTVFRVEAGPGGTVEVLAEPGRASTGDRVGLRPRPGGRAHLFPAAEGRLPPGFGDGPVDPGTDRTDGTNRDPGAPPDAAAPRP